MRRLLRLIDVVPSAVPVFVPATYAVTVAVNWEVLQQSRAWSESQIFVTHSDGYDLWGEGLIASSGLAHFVKTDDELPLLSEISHKAAAGLVGDYLVADALSFYDINKSGSSFIVARSPHTKLSMVTAIHVVPESWFTGFTGVSAAVPAAAGIDVGDKDKDMVWLDSFTVPIFPYEVGEAESPQVGAEESRENEQDEPGARGEVRTLNDSSAVPTGGGSGGPELWAKPHAHLPPGGPISRVVALVEADYNVPMAYVEFHRVPNVWENSSSVGRGIFRRWRNNIPSLTRLPFILLLGAVGAVAACLGGYVLMNACCSQLKRKNGGYQQVV